jgi:hypothetical protein
LLLLVPLVLLLEVLEMLLLLMLLEQELGAVDLSDLLSSSPGGDRLSNERLNAVRSSQVHAGDIVGIGSKAGRVVGVQKLDMTGEWTGLGWRDMVNLGQSLDAIRGLIHQNPKLGCINMLGAG